MCENRRMSISGAYIMWVTQHLRLGWLCLPFKLKRGYRVQMHEVMYMHNLWHLIALIVPLQNHVWTHTNFPLIYVPLQSWPHPPRFSAPTSLLLLCYIPGHCFLLHKLSTQSTVDLPSHTETQHNNVLQYWQWMAFCPTKSGGAIAGDLKQLVRNT